MESRRDLVYIPLNKKCPSCENGSLYKKLGKNGYFIGCDQFKNGCRHAESIPFGKCPLCGFNVVGKKSKKNRKFYGCEKYSITGCDFVMLDKPSSKTCSKCGSIMGEKIRKEGITLTCQNKECGFLVKEITKEENEAS